MDCPETVDCADRAEEDAARQHLAVIAPLIAKRYCFKGRSHTLSDPTADQIGRVSEGDAGDFPCAVRPLSGKIRDGEPTAGMSPLQSAARLDALGVQICLTETQAKLDITLPKRWDIISRKRPQPGL